MTKKTKKPTAGKAKAKVRDLKPKKNARGGRTGKIDSADIVIWQDNIGGSKQSFTGFGP